MGGAYDKNLDNSTYQKGQLPQDPNNVIGLLHFRLMNVSAKNFKGLHARVDVPDGMHITDFTVPGAKGIENYEYTIHYANHPAVSGTVAAYGKVAVANGDDVESIELTIPQLLMGQFQGTSAGNDDNSFAWSQLVSHLDYFIVNGQSLIHI